MEEEKEIEDNTISNWGLAARYDAFIELIRQICKDNPLPPRFNHFRCRVVCPVCGSRLLTFSNVPQFVETKIRERSRRAERWLDNMDQIITCENPDCKYCYGIIAHAYLPSGWSDH